jgi:fructuronate reductase
VTGQPRLGRETPAPPVRIVHLGLGNFVRAHLAWYTAHAGDAADWGIAGFTGRRPDTAAALAPQEGRYTLITRGTDGDQFEVIDNLSAVHPADDHDQFLDYLRRREVAVLTLTVTEAGYQRDAEGHLDAGKPAVAADIAALREDPTTLVTTMPARIVAGLIARRAAGAGPITVLSLENLPHNGAVAATVVTELARHVDETLADWIAEQVDFGSSMVDRITPATTDQDREIVAAAQGYEDAAPVPTEPFSEWVLEGRFPAGRPDWEAAGAVIVDDVTPYEQRKLWLLNGSHSLLAYAGSIRGHEAIHEAIADEACREWVEQFWEEACRHLTLPADDLAAYRSALLERYTNPRVRHLLTQIATDGSIKIGVRIAPTIQGERAAGRLPVGAATVVAAWLLHLRGAGAPLKDEHADTVREAASPPELAAAAAQVLGYLVDGLGSDAELVEAVVRQADLIPG